MEMRLQPEPDPGTEAAVARAVATAGIDVRGRPAGYASAWRRAALGEAAHHSDPVADAVADHVAVAASAAERPTATPRD